jgi:uncharacterized membrane protein (UPF0127 family)
VSREGTVTVLTGGGVVVCPRCRLAKNPLRRLQGLLGRRNLAADEGLLLQPASSVHTLFMRFPIDVVFLDRDLRVLRVADSVPPWRAVRRRRSRLVLELPAGAAARLQLRADEQLVIS